MPQRTVLFALLSGIGLAVCLPFAGHALFFTPMAHDTAIMTTAGATVGVVSGSLLGYLFAKLLIFQFLNEKELWPKRNRSGSGTMLGGLLSLLEQVGHLLAQTAYSLGQILGAAGFGIGLGLATHSLVNTNPAQRQLAAIGIASLGVLSALAASGLLAYVENNDVLVEELVPLPTCLFGLCVCSTPFSL